MTPQTFLSIAVAPAMLLLPEKMNTTEAVAMVLAICLQESRLSHRVQVGGPARGYPQFEFGGIKGVLNHKASQPLIRAVLDRLDYDYSPDTSYVAIGHNDVLAFCYARLLLYTLPEALPARADANGAWAQYIDAWRPGKPRFDSWAALYEQAWVEVTKP